MEQELSEHEFWIWLAGLFDGEGSISILEHYTGAFGLSLSVQITISNKDTDLLEFVSYMLSKFAVVESAIEETHNCWKLAVVGNKRCRGILEKLLPYLIVKRRKAQLALEFIKERENVPHLAPQDKKMSKRALEIALEFYRDSKRKPKYIRELEAHGTPMSEASRKGNRSGN